MPKFQGMKELDKFAKPHAYLLNEEEQKWFDSECDRVYKQTGYHINRRSSGDSAFRMFLLSDKGFSVKDIVDLGKIPKNTLKSYMQEFFNTIADPKKTAEENLNEVGRIHRNASEKMAEHTIPNPGKIKNLDSLGGIQAEMYVLNNMFIDDTQDMKDFLDGDRDLEKKNAFYNGAGGEANYVPTRGKWAVMSQFYGDMFNKLCNGFYQPHASAMVFDVTKDFFAEFGGKKIKDIPAYRGPEYMQISGTVTIVSAMDTDKLSDPEYTAYVNGKAKAYPGKEQFSQQINNSIHDSRVQFNKKTSVSVDNLTNHAFDVYVKDFSENSLNIDRVDKLSEKEQKRLAEIYDRTIAKLYTGAAMLTIQSKGIDQFDFLSTPDGKTIRETVKENYKNLSPLEEEKIMKMETVRQILKNEDGVKIQFAGYGSKGGIIKTGENRLKKVPDDIKFNIDKEIVQNDVKDFHNDPLKKNGCSDMGQKFAYIIRDFASNHADILKKHNMTAYDCFYIGDKSLTELYREKYPKEKINEQVASGFLAAEAVGNKPIFATALTENAKGGLIRKAVPVTFTGQVRDAYNRVALKEGVRMMGNLTIKGIEKREEEARIHYDAKGIAAYDSMVTRAEVKGAVKTEKTMNKKKKASKVQFEEKPDETIKDVEKNFKAVARYGMEKADILNQLKEYRAELALSQKDAEANLFGMKNEKGEDLVEGSKLYQNMTRSLAKAIKAFEDDSCSHIEMMEALSELKVNSKNYHDEREGAITETGKIREFASLEMLNNVENMAERMDNALESITNSKSFNPDKKIDDQFSLKDINEAVRDYEKTLPTDLYLDAVLDPIRGRMSLEAKNDLNADKVAHERKLFLEELNVRHKFDIENAASFEPKQAGADIAALAENYLVKKNIDLVMKADSPEYIKDLKQDIFKDQFEKDLKNLSENSAFKYIVGKYPNDWEKKWSNIERKSEELMRSKDDALYNIGHNHGSAEKFITSEASKENRYKNMATVMVDKILSDPANELLRNTMALDSKKEDQLVTYVAGELSRTKMLDKPNKIDTKKLSGTLKDVNFSKKLLTGFSKVEKANAKREHDMNKKKTTGKEVSKK